MKSVLTSIRPIHLINIIYGLKDWEIRKNRPNLDRPFKDYIYCTKNYNSNGHDLLEIHINGKIHKANCKVIGEFICDKIVEIQPCVEYYSFGYDVDDDMLKEICLTREELMNYGKGRKLFAWHISDLVIYDNPKELSEFKKIDCERWCFYAQIGIKKRDCPECQNKRCIMQKPPQSWCYVEELSDD